MAGRLTLRLKRPLWGYAIAELAAGLLALAVTLALPRLPSALAAIGLPGGGPVFARLLLVSVLMVPPTVAMGASLPMLAAWVGRTMKDAGVEVGMLYTVNTLGAAVGCALAGFWWVASLGVSGTAYLACALNVLVGFGTSPFVLGGEPDTFRERVIAWGGFAIVQRTDTHSFTTIEPTMSSCGLQ